MDTKLALQSKIELLIKLNRDEEAHAALSKFNELYPQEPWFKAQKNKLRDRAYQKLGVFDRFCYHALKYAKGVTQETPHYFLTTADKEIKRYQGVFELSDAPPLKICDRYQQFGLFKINSCFSSASPNTLPSTNSGSTRSKVGTF